MAFSVVDAALSVARSAAAEEVALQVGVEGDLGIIKDELELMQTYLMSTDEERSQDPVARVWARQVRDVAYDVEDCIEDARIHLSDDSRSWWWCSPSKILKRRRIAKEVTKLRDRVDSACKRRRLYGPAPALPSAAVADPGPEGRRELEAAAPAAGVDLRKLLARRDDDKSLIVASICTSGTTTTTTGTTLAGEAYDALAATGQFRCRAWVTVRNPFNLGEFFRSLLRQIHVNSSPGEEQVVEGATVVDVQETIETMSTQQLMSSVARNLGHRRYLLVLDGVSTRDEWDSIRLYLRPDVENANRIIVTSQRDDVAKYCAGGQRSSSFWLSSGGALLSAFCSMV
ncbi:disease resistance protein PIK6-NP-like [Panicum virgatum]|uniref:disease resistance protein PIK6-NP-like n=1 Tax=Panicum virgatum TaxID=38727 RepID=UPI0019D616C2|nr:disease resistance protein PIK6-NP-like [Panicum virgatum]